MRKAKVGMELFLLPVFLISDGSEVPKDNTSVFFYSAEVTLIWGNQLDMVSQYYKT